MTKGILTFAMTVSFVLAAVHAQSAITGRWQGKTPNGFELQLELTASEKDLTGTLTRDRQALPITDGSVSNNTFTFNVAMNDRKEGFSGEIDGDQMKVWLDRQGPAAAAILKRVTENKRDKDVSHAAQFYHLARMTAVSATSAMTIAQPRTNPLTSSR